MNKFMNHFEEKLVPIANVVGSNRILKCISTAFNMLMPIIIIGSIFTMLQTLQIDVYQNFIISTGLSELISLISKFTIEALSVYVAFLAGYVYITNEGLPEDAIPVGLLSLLSFFIMIPLANVKSTLYLGFDYLGAKGLFTALIVGILVGFIYSFVVKHNWVIHMPDGVPPTVAKSFNALIPGFIIVFVFLIIGGIFKFTVHCTFSEWFYSLLSTPLSAISGSLGAMMLLQLINSLFWFFGIHGGQIATPFLIILFMQAGVENQAAYAAGHAMPYILTCGFVFLIQLGGIGNTIGLAIDMFCFSKSKRYKQLGKLSILPSCCSINEPIMFGMPIILNPIMAIPFFIVPQLMILIAYFTMNFGLVSYPRIAMGATGTPLLFDGLLIAGVSGIVLQIILIIVSIIAYYPFFKVQDDIAYKEEQALEKAE